MDDERDLIRFDLLKEINNIGTGNALTSLSILINRKIAMKVPKIKFVDFKDVPDILGGADRFIIGVLSHLIGEIEGIIIFVLDIKSANYLISTLLNRDLESVGEGKSFDEFDEMERSVLTEVGNIMFSSYCSSLNLLTKNKIKSSVPYISMDMAGAILSVPAIEFSKISDKVIFIESVFALEGHEISGYLIMVPDAKSFDVIVNSLGMGV